MSPKPSPRLRPAPDSSPLARHAHLVVLVLLCLAACGPEPPESRAAAPVSAGAGDWTILNPWSPERPLYHSFGAVPHGTTVRHTFRLRNGEDRAVKVLSIQGGCQCTRFLGFDHVQSNGERVKGNTRSKEEVLVVPAGGVAEFLVGIETGLLRSYNQDKLEIIRVRTDSQNTPFLTFELNVKPLRLFQFAPGKRLSLSDVPRSAGSVGTVRVATADLSSPARILAVVSHSDFLEVELNESVYSGELMWTLHIRSQAGMPPGPLRGEVVLSTTDGAGDGDAGRETIEVIGQIVEDIVVYPRIFAFSSMAAGEPAECAGKLVSLVPGMYVEVDSITLEGEPELVEHFEVSYEPTVAGAEGRSPEWEIRLEADDLLPTGPFRGTLLVKLADAEPAEIRVSFSGLVR